MSGAYLQASLDKLTDASREDVIEICINPDGSVWGEFQGDRFMSPLESSLTPTEIKDIGTQIASASNST